MDTGTTGAAQPGRRRRDAGVDECIRNCLECYEICTETIPHCLSKGGKHAEKDHIITMSICARICQTAAEVMLTGSPLHMHVCRACAEICAECERECDRMADDEQMKRCSKICKACGESCKRMAGH